MDNWFTIEQIDRDTFSISEYKHWEETHCYLLCGEKYAILIDTGLGVSNIRKIVDSLTKLPVMTVTTHVHWDHIGGHKYFDKFACQVLLEMKQKRPVLKEVNNGDCFSRKRIAIGQELLNCGHKRTRKLCKMLFAFGYLLFPVIIPCLVASGIAFFVFRIVRI